MVDHKVAVSVDSTTSIPLGNLKLRHEDRLQPLLLRTNAFLEGSPSDLGIHCAAKNRFGGVCYMEGNRHEGGD